MRGTTATLALALCLLGCGSTTGSGGPVHLVTGTVPGYTDSGGCFTDFALGPLIADPTYGTAVMDGPNGSAPIMWRPGYTGRRSGSEVEVLDPSGNVVATSGKTYQIEGGYWFDNPRYFVACGYVLEQ